MYPNPAKTSVSVKYYAPEQGAAVIVRIYTASYRLVRKFTFTAGSRGDDNIAAIPLDNMLANGVYYLLYQYESKNRKNRQTQVLVVLR
jgi:hypothetical protein